MNAVKPAVSIILPVFNGARYLEEALKSIVEQDFQDWELIAVDDGSSDHSLKILEDFKRQRSGFNQVTVISKPKNEGLPAALSTGFKLASGSFLTWTSHDNRYRPEAIQTLLKVLIANPSLDLVYSNFYWIDSAGSVVKGFKVKTPDYLWLESCVGPSFLYRRHVYEKIGDYRSEFFLAEDYDYWLRVSDQFKLGCIPDFLYEYRIHQDSLSARKRFEVSKALLAVLEANYAMAKTRKARSFAHVNIAWQLAVAGRRLAAMKHVLLGTLEYLPIWLYSGNSLNIRICSFYVLVGPRVFSLVRTLYFSLMRALNMKTDRPWEPGPDKQS